MSGGAPPPSGVAGLTPTQVRAQLARMGWTGALPIHAHNGAHTSPGKAPGIKAWAQRARFEGPATTATDLEDWSHKEFQWPGTGIACGDVVTIDADFATDPNLAEHVTALAIEVFGETPFLRQGQAPKVALVYRAAEAIPSVSLKTADGCGDGLDILAEARQFVAFGVHAKTRQPYAWIGAESPLTAGPDEAPEVTQAQIDGFLGRLRSIVELNGTGGRAGRTGGGGSAQIVRNADGLVVDGREFHLTRIVYAMALSMKSEGEDITVSGLTERAWTAFAASTALEDSRWSPDAARVKVVALLDRVRRGFVTLDPTPTETGEAIVPTYPDRRVSVAEAETETRAVVTAFFTEHVPAWRVERGAWEVEAEEAKERGQEAPEKPTPVSWGARVETAIGKTALAIAGAAEAAKAGIHTVYAAPMHSLLAELAERFAAEGVTARVYRGYTTPDPDAPGLAMCLDIPAMQDAREAGTAIPSAVCERKIDGQKHLCAFYDRCGMQQQRQAKAAVWLVPQALLFQAKPAFIPTPDALVIDEGITMGALPDAPARMSLDAIEHADLELTDEVVVFSNTANDLETSRGDLLRALRAHPEDGPLQRAVLHRHGVTAATAGAAYSLEWRRMRDPGITPGMPPQARKTCAAATGRHNAEVKMLAGIWGELRTFLAGDAETSGRLSLRYDEGDAVRILERRSLDSVRSTWSAPALLIDATLPDAPLLEPVVGHRVEIRADITAKWSPHVKVRQILNAPVTARKLGILETDELDTSRRVVTDLLRLIRLRSAVVWPRVVVVIAPMRLIEKLTDAGLPENVETAHFGAVAGIDRWSSAADLICIGRLQPGPGITEPLAGIVTGTVPETIPPNAKGGRWYPRVQGGVRLATGAGAMVEHGRHPDPTVEALRWQITEGGLIQAIGRLRALRRTGKAPGFLDIINDMPLPISVDAAVQWETAKVGAWAEMAPEGVLLESAADVQACFPDVAPTRKSAREMDLPTLALTSIREISIDVRANVRRASYKRLGRFAPARAILLPNAPADLKSWLSDRLGAIEWVRFEDEQPALSQEAPAPASPQRAAPSAADYDSALVARYRLVASRDPDTAQPALVRAEVIRFDPAAPISFPPLIAGRLGLMRAAQSAGRIVVLEAAE